MGAREERIGLNEAVFREVNERIEHVAETFDLKTEQLDLVCECGNADCEERISMTHSEYETLRSESHQFAVYPGHEYPDVERVIARQKGYDIVQKSRGAPERIAEQTDPRRP
jgi:restriction endonuclease Mrr